MSWLVLASKVLFELPDDLKSCILKQIFFEKACIIQKSAKKMMFNAVERSERIAIRYYETVLCCRDEPVCIINGKWKWKFNININYEMRVRHTLHTHVTKLGYICPTYTKIYKYPLPNKRSIRPFLRSYYFMDQRTFLELDQTPSVHPFHFLA